MKAIAAIVASVAFGIGCLATYQYADRLRSQASAHACAMQHVDDSRLYAACYTSRGLAAPL